MKHALAVLLAACSLEKPAIDPRQEELFDPEVVQEIRLELTPADLATLEASSSMNPFPYVRATFRYKDVTLENVGVRFKGNSSRNPSTTVKRSFLIKFDEYVEGQELFGLERLALDNAIQFGSLFSERLLTEILTAENVPAVRSTYARLDINGVYKGVYVALERVDKKFLKRTFADNDGDLFKCDEGGPGGNLAYLGDAASAYSRDGRPTFAAETNEDTAQLADVIALARTLDSGSIDDVGAAFETEQFTRVMAIMMFGGAFDQYTGFQPHNYYLYRDPTTSKWSYVAHDLDVGFADNAFARNGMPGIPVIDGWKANDPRPIQPLPLVDRVLEDPVLRERYRAHALDYLERYFEPTKLGARLDALYAQIADDLVSDPYPKVRITNPEIVGYPAIVADIKAFMRRRYDTARTQLGAQ